MTDTRWIDQHVKRPRIETIIREYIPRPMEYIHNQLNLSADEFQDAYVYIFESLYDWMSSKEESQNELGFELEDEDFLDDNYICEFEEEVVHSYVNEAYVARSENWPMFPAPVGWRTRKYHWRTPDEQRIVDSAPRLRL